MHDPSFEQQVQQKMQKLEFTPSESVWNNIDNALSSRKKSRAFPIFWAAVFFGLSIGVAGTWLYFKTSGAYEAAGSRNMASAERAGAKDAPTTKADGTDSPAAANNNGQAVSKNGVTSGGESEAGRRVQEGIAKTDRSGISGIAAVPAQRASNEKTNQSAENKPERAGHSVAVAAMDAGNGSRKGKTGPVAERAEVWPVAEDDKDGPNDPDSRSTDLSVKTTKPARTPYPYIPRLANMTLARNGVGASLLTTKKSSTGLDKLPRSSRAWQFGFSTSVGYSSVQKPWLTHMGENGLASANANMYNVLAANANYSTNKRPLSPVTPGLSFTAGMLARKSLSSRWSASAGLNLHYYSTQTKVGEEIDGYQPIAASLLTTGAGSPQRRYPYYAIGNDQQLTNKYYFLELPVAVQYKLNHSREWPVYLEGGASVSYLVGSNAVYYSDDNAVYYKDIKELNKTQVHLSTGVMAGLPIKGVQVQAGPQVQYSLTSLDNVAVTSDQHLLYVGLHVVLMPGR